MAGRVPVGGRVRRPPGPGPGCRQAVQDRTAGGRGRAPDDRGGVTVEAALALCSLTVFLVLAVGALGAVTGAIRCTDAARELARLAARGEPERGRDVAAAVAPVGARLTLAHGDGTVTAEVSTTPLPPLPLRIGGRAVAAVEPGARVR